MSYKIKTLGPTYFAARHGFPHVIEFSRTEYFTFKKLANFCYRKFGRDYRPHYTRPGKKAKWYLENRTGFYRLCFKTENMTTFALLHA